MSLNGKQVEGIAHLARLAIDPAELPEYAVALSKILNFVEQLDSVPDAGVAPMAHPLADQVQRLRPDEVTESDRREKFQGNATRVEAGLYLVPKVIE